MDCPTSAYAERDESRVSPMQLGLYMLSICCWIVWYYGNWAFIIEYRDNFGVTIEDDEEYYKITYITTHILITALITYAAYHWVFEIPN